MIRNMTKQQAIDVLRNYKIDFGRPGAFDMVTAIGIAEKALEKQIPEKVIDNTPTDTDVWYQCPSCKGDLTKIRGRYCGYCGKAIDRDSCQRYTVEDVLAKWGVDVNADIGEEKGNDKF